MSVKRTIKSYGSLAETVFSDVKQTGGEGRFKASKLEKVIKEIVKEQTDKENDRMIETPPNGRGCKT